MCGGEPSPYWEGENQPAHVSDLVGSLCGVQMTEGDGAESRGKSASHRSKLRCEVTTVDVSRLPVCLQDVLEGCVCITAVNVHTGKPGKAPQTAAPLAAQPV